MAISVAFDLRDPQRSGIARVATSIARAFLRDHSDEFSVSLAGPIPRLRELDAPSWGAARIVDWSEPRYTMLGLGWRNAALSIGAATWYFPHWDVPFLALTAPFVSTIHDVAHLRLREFSGPKRFLARQWIAQTVRRARRIAAISTYTAAELRAEYPEAASKISLVPNGVDDVFFQPAPGLPDRIAGPVRDAPYMLSVGIRKERKNLRVGVDILQHIPDLKWIVLGEWFADWEQVEALARAAGVFDRMIVLDRQDENTLRSLYASARFLLLPSRYEGFGLPVLEALASGTPVVASRATSIPEVLGEDGWLCGPDDAACFVEAAREVLGLGAARTAVAERGRARAREFTWKRAADGLAQLLRASASQSAR